MSPFSLDESFEAPDFGLDRMLSPVSTKRFDGQCGAADEGQHENAPQRFPDQEPTRLPMSRQPLDRILV